MAPASWSAALVAPPVLSLVVRLAATERVQLPSWLGSMLHGAIGRALRRVACSEQCHARHAAQRDRCAYARLFESPSPPRAASERVAAMAPHRMWLVPPAPAEPRDLEAGRTLDFEIRLVRSGEADLGWLLAALERMATKGLGRRRGRMRLDGVSSEGKPIWQAGQARGRPASIVTPVLPSGPIVLRTVTPLRIVRDGSVQPPRFEDLVAAAARRIVAIAAFFGSGEPALNIAELRAAAAAHRARIDAVWSPYRMVRYSSSQSRRHPMEGHTGEMTIDDAGPFADLLSAAAPLSIGKSTAFGFGAYELRSGAS